MLKERLLLLLNDGGAAPEQGQSFAERKAQQLREERGVREASEPPGEPSAPVQDPNDVPGYPEDGTPEAPESVQPDSGMDDGEQPIEALDDTEAPEGTPEDDYQDGETGEQSIDWEKRYNDTRGELTRLQQERGDRDAELSDMMAGSMQLKYDLEDQLDKAKQYTAYYVDGINAQVAQMEQAFNTGMIEPDKLPQARQAYVQLQQQKQALDARIDQIEKTRSEADDKRRQREAEITRVRLSRTIPGWSHSKWQEMRGAAAERGYTADEFDKITDYRYFELLHDSMMLRSASQTVGDVRLRKQPKPPRGRNKQRQPRSADGRFRKAQQEFRDSPNQKGKFAAMKFEDLQRERR